MKEIHVFIRDLFYFNNSSQSMHESERMRECRKLIAVKLYILGVSTVYEIIAEHLCDIMKNLFSVWMIVFWRECFIMNGM